jgi:hypothetical protein
MVVNDYVLSQEFSGAGFAAFGDAWIDYCGKTYANDAGLRAKCESKPMGFLTLAPWTVIGKAQRGLPNVASNILSTVTGGGGSTDPVTGGPMPMDEGILGIPKVIFWAGAGTLVLGIGLLAFKKKRRKS